MQLTRHSDYALRVMLYLAGRPEELSGIRQIAEAYDISHNHLMKVVHALVKAGYLLSERGRYGGIKLSRGAADINVGEVIRRIENIELAPCGSCRINGGCGLQSVFGEAISAFLGVLEQYTLQDMLDHSPKVEDLFPRE